MASNCEGFPDQRIAGGTGCFLKYRKQEVIPAFHAGEWKLGQNTLLRKQSEHTGKGYDSVTLDPLKKGEGSLKKPFKKDGNPMDPLKCP